MRKVIYKEWVPGIETEEYRMADFPKSIELERSGKRFIDGTNCHIEKGGLFHGFFPMASENNDGSFGNFTEALIELEDGSMVNVYPEHIRFVDKHEDEQDFEKKFRWETAAKVYASRVGGYYGRTNGMMPYPTLQQVIEEVDEIISELKKQKP